MGQPQKYDIFLRLTISLIAIILPVIFLFKGIYGSFIFTFSIPLIWQVGFRGEPINSLGVRVDSLGSSIAIGVITGCLLGFLGGAILKIIGMTGHVFTDLNKLQFSFGIFQIAFPLQKEVGYRLMSISNLFLGTCLYLLFCIFVIGTGEEIFWRGFVQKKISGYLPVNISIWITAVLFSMIHFYIFTILPIKSGIAFLFLIAVSGGVWGHLFKCFSNIWSAAISHGIAAFIIWKYYFFAGN